MGIKLGLVGLGMFGSQFAKLFKSHPLVDKIALCDCEAAKVRKFLEDPFMAPKVSPRDCYETLDDLCKSDVDAVVVITQPWLHAPQCLQVLNAGKHVYSAVPLISLPDDAEVLDWGCRIAEAVKRSGRQYMLGETTVYRPQTMLCARLAAEGRFGEFVYAEGEYVHDLDNPGCNLRRVQEGRTTGKVGEQHEALMAPYRARGLKSTPMNYPTHSISGPIHVMKTRALSVSAIGTPNTNHDPFFADYDRSNIAAFYRLANGASLRICEFREVAARSFDILNSETFRIFGKNGSFTRNHTFLHNRNIPGEEVVWQEQDYTDAEMRDKLPPEVERAFRKLYDPNASDDDFQTDFQPQGHGGSHPYLVHNFVKMVAENGPSPIPIEEALHYMAMGVAASRSARKDGETIPVEQFD